MSQLLRFILLVVLIAAVSVGVYYWFEEQQTGVEKAADDVEKGAEGLRERMEGREREGEREPERQRQQPAPKQERPS